MVSEPLLLIRINNSLIYSRRVVDMIMALQMMMVYCFTF